MSSEKFWLHYCNLHVISNAISTNSASMRFLLPALIVLTRVGLYPIIEHALSYCSFIFASISQHLYNLHTCIMRAIYNVLFKLIWFLKSCGSIDIIKLYNASQLMQISLLWHFCGRNNCTNQVQPVLNILNINHLQL